MTDNDELRLTEFYLFGLGNRVSPLVARRRRAGYHIANQVTRQSSYHARVQADKLFSSDTTLTAFCQLAEFRLDEQQCGISTVNSHQSDVLADWTHTTKLAYSTLGDDPGDPLAIGVGEVSRVNFTSPSIMLRFIRFTQYDSLYENIIALPLGLGSQTPPCSTVPDLHDSCFSAAPYITSGPAIRFYCGTPITSS